MHFEMLNMNLAGKFWDQIFDSYWISTTHVTAQKMINLLLNKCLYPYIWRLGFYVQRC